MNSRENSQDPGKGYSIELDHVSLVLKGNTILKDIVLRIGIPACATIIGHNGAGKTTLLKVICGLIKPSSGKVSILGKPLEAARTKLQRCIAFLPQDVSIDPRIPISVEEVVEIGRFGNALLGSKSDEDQRAIEQAMEVTGIVDLRKKPFGLLSAGQKQRVALARALAQEADIMLLDEPLSNLDPEAQEETCATIDRIYESREVAILLVTHLIEKIPRSCSTMFRMEKGRIVGEEKPPRHILEGQLESKENPNPLSLR